MDLASLSDFEKLQQDDVIQIEAEGHTAYLRIAGPLDFDIMGNMLDAKISDDQRVIKTLIACICNIEGKRLFDMDNPEHYDLVKRIPIKLQLALLQHIGEFFGIKKKELKELV